MLLLVSNNASGSLIKFRSLLYFYYLCFTCKGSIEKPNCLNISLNFIFF